MLAPIVIALPNSFEHFTLIHLSLSFLFPALTVSVPFHNLPINRILDHLVYRVLQIIIYIKASIQNYPCLN